MTKVKNRNKNSLQYNYCVIGCIDIGSAFFYKNITEADCIPPTPHQSKFVSFLGISLIKLDSY